MITINATQNRNDKKQVVFFTIKKNGEDFKFSHGAVPVELDTDVKIKNWLKEQEEKLVGLIEGKIKNGTYRNEHPAWVELVSAIDNASSLSELKIILKEVIKSIN